MKKINKAKFLYFAFFLCGCQSVTSQPESKDSVGIEFDVIYFRAGMPGTEMNLMDALINVDNSIQSLDAVASFLKKRNDIYVQVVGFSDKNECVLVDCDKLSLNRAHLVFNWLINSGVSRKSLYGYFGCGDKSPVDFSYTELQRQGNRRVEIRVLDEGSPGGYEDRCNQDAY